MSQKITMYKTETASTISVIDAPSFEAMDVKGWRGVHTEDKDIFMFIFDIAANAEEFPVHSSPDTWLAYVISGSGTLFTGSDSGEKLTGTPYNAGDFIVFEPDTPHGWLNGNEESKILFTKRSEA